MIRMLSMVVLILGLTPFAAWAQKDKARMKSATFAGLKLRSIGPAVMSGRISDVAIDPVKPNTWYVAVGSGGVFKTVNAGTTWQPIFDNYSSYSIGCVTIDPTNRSTIWVGTGEDVGGRHAGYGDGVYKSTDGGKSFKNMGLSKSEHIAKIVVDPRDSNVVYVASQGPLWSGGGERGVYKTRDGGKSWERILGQGKGPYTGATDVVIHPSNPDVLYAALHQRHRSVAALINGGPESGLFKSADAGKTWRELRNGIPGQDKGKMSLAISPQRTDVMYVTIELAGRKGGFWRSADRGESWSKMSDYVGGGTGPHYYQEIWADPHRFDVIYQANVRLGRSEDGGKTWNSVETIAKHVDNHAVAFHPTDKDFVLVGCDGGLYRSYDYAKTWLFTSNLPLTQFYKLSLDNDYPFYNIVGGTQDNNTQYGPSRTNHNSGIRNSEWKVVLGGDGHDNAIDPKNPNIIYCEAQQGWLNRYDRRSGVSVMIQPVPKKGGTTLRFNWDSPIFISPHNNQRLYFGSQFLHRSDDRGDSWQTISPDLSRRIDRFKMKLMGRVWSIDALWDLLAMSQFGNITSITESPQQEGLLYVGTDDGLIHVSENGGKSWRKVEKIYGIPQRAFVNDIKADLHDVNTVYAVFDNHKVGDYRPYLVKSTDRGKTWQSIGGNLPQRHLVWRIVQDHVKKNLLFIGTEFGLFFSVDSGKQWIKLTGGVPTIPFRDLEIQKRESDLVGATFGRSFYVFDDYSALRNVSEKTLAKEAVLFRPRHTYQYPQSYVMAQARRKGSQGDGFYTADNPPYGAVFTYYLRDGLKTRKQQRQALEAKRKKAGGNNPRPDFAELKVEEREPPRAMVFVITGQQGNIIHRVNGPATAGFHRVAWNLTYAPFGGSRGPAVVPGTYRVQMFKQIDGKLIKASPRIPFRVVDVAKTALPRQNRQEVLKFQLKAGELYQAVTGANLKLTESLKEATAIQQALAMSRSATRALKQEARKIELGLMDVQEFLSGDTTKLNREQLARFPVIERASNAYFRSRSHYGPTKTARSEYKIARAEYQQAAKKLRQLIEVRLASLRGQMDKAGIRWTPGRKIPTLRPEK